MQQHSGSQSGASGWLKVFPFRLPRILRYILIGVCALGLTILAATSGRAITAHSPIVSEAKPPTDLTLNSLVEQGRQSYQNGQFSQAVQFWQQAVKLLEQQGDSLNQAAVLSNLALAYQQLGQGQAAHQAIIISLTILRRPLGQEANRKPLLAQALTIQAGLQMARGEAELAVATWNEAIVYHRQLGNQTAVLRCLLNQSQALRALGLYRRAQELLEQVNQLVQNQPDSLLKAAALVNFGDALRLTGDGQKSEAVLQESLRLATQLGSATDTTAALIGLGNTARSYQTGQKAIDYYQKASAIAPSASLKLQAQLNQLTLLTGLEQWPEASTLANQLQPQVVGLAPNRTGIYSRIQLAQQLIKLSRSRASGQSLPPSNVLEIAQMLATAATQAKQLADVRVESYALGTLGELYEQTGQWTEARRLSEQALTLAQSINAPDIAYRWQWQLGRVFNALGKRDKAITAYTEAVKSLSAIRSDLISGSLETQFSFRESVEPVYRQLVGLLLQPDGNLALKANTGTVQQSNLKQARSLIESLQLAELDNFFREACLTGVRAQVDQIDHKAAVFYPIILADRLEVILSLPNRTLHHYTSTIPQAELEELLSEMRQSLRRTSLEEERLTIARKLYDILVRQAEPDLVSSGVKTLTFVLDGSLKNLPMAALYDGQKYLIEKYSVALTPGLQLLGPKAIQRQQLKLLVGGLSEARQGFIALPGVEQEVKEIQTQLSAEVLFNQAFTSTALEKQIRAAPFPVVHLATHGQFSSKAEDTFVLTWDNRLSVKQLGELLRKREQQTQTPIELLVLSACQTADGDKRSALGLAGMAVRSGARSTLATLWPVDDQSTSAFMLQFYQELGLTQKTKAEAVRQAQLALLQQPEFEHPFYWAPFVLVGNWL